MRRDPHAPKLLRTVRGKPYATSSDHQEEVVHSDTTPLLLRTVAEKPPATIDDSRENVIRSDTITARRSTRTGHVEPPLPTTPATSVSSSLSSGEHGDPVQIEEEDFDRSPEGSSDEEDAIDLKRRVSLDMPETLCGKENKKPAKVEEEEFDRRLEGSDVEVEVEVKRKNVRAKSDKENAKPKRGAKRAAKDKDDTWGLVERRGSHESAKAQAPREFDEDAEPEWMSQMSKAKRPRLENMHAIKQKKRAPVRQKATTFSKKDAAKRDANISKHPRAKADEPSARRPGFKKLAMPDFVPQPKLTGFQLPPSSNQTSALSESSSPLSSVASEEPETIEMLDLSGSMNQASTVDCPSCGGEVEKMLYEEFVDRHGLGDSLSFKWERRFCDHHKTYQARSQWMERGYPDIEWDGLSKRMRKHDDFLIAVLNDTRQSHYRELLKKRQRPRRRGIGQLVQDKDSRPGGSVGYYGPRGEKLMVEHIIEHLSEHIRERAATDKLVSAVGAMGGVTGFVQAVLVPHMAELLIMEDMKLTEDRSARAHDIIAASAELGERLHPVAEDKIDDSDDDTL